MFSVLQNQYNMPKLCVFQHNNVLKSNLNAVLLRGCVSTDLKCNPR